MAGYDTNLAAEFHVLSILHRLGLNATLTLGNRKAVDIVVTKRAGEVITIDVKGQAGATGWFVDNVGLRSRRHFLVFVTFLDRITEPDTIPEIYVVPAPRLSGFTSKYPSGKRVVHLTTLRRKGGEYRNGWRQLVRRAL